jgi:Mg2+ and Co2+ transporter CorA
MQHETCVIIAASSRRFDGIVGHSTVARRLPAGKIAAAANGFLPRCECCKICVARSPVARSVFKTALPDNAVWIDLDKPTAAEDPAVERLAGIAVPTREDMQEIEISSRLYIENGARYMTASLMCAADA